VPNVIDLITRDHRQVEELFQQIEAGEGDVKQLVDRCAQLLLAHSVAEAEVVYPAIEQAAPDEKEDVADSKAEHGHIEDMLAELTKGDPDTPGWDGTLAAMMAEVRHHVEEEEQEILPAFAEATDEAELERLGEAFEARELQELGEAGGGAAGGSSSGGERTKEELYEEAKEKDVPGRSSMTKDELARAVEEA
jgi:hemerythrin superfamily protein